MYPIVFFGAVSEGVGYVVADVGPASVMVGNIVQGNRLASAQGRDMGIVDEESDSARKVSMVYKIILFFYLN